MSIEGREYNPNEPMEIISCELAQERIIEIQQDAKIVDTAEAEATLRHLEICNNPECKKIIES